MLCRPSSSAATAAAVGQEGATGMASEENAAGAVGAAETEAKAGTGEGAQIGEEGLDGVQGHVGAAFLSEAQKGSEAAASNVPSALCPLPDIVVGCVLVLLWYHLCYLCWQEKQ